MTQKTRLDDTLISVVNGLSESSLIEIYNHYVAGTMATGAKGEITTMEQFVNSID